MKSAEQELIGDLLTHGEDIAKVCSELKPEHFTDNFLRDCYSALVKCYENGEEIGLATVVPKLINQIRDEKTSATMLMSCLVFDPNISISTLKDLILKDHKARQLDELVKNFKTDGDSVDKDIADLIANLTVMAKDSSRDEGITLADLARECENNYFKPREKKHLAFGLKDIDMSIGGVDGGDVVVIAARPAVGKSALSLQIMDFIAQDNKVDYFNLEMVKSQVYERWLARRSGLQVNRIRLATTFLNDEKDRYLLGNQSLKESDNIKIYNGTFGIYDIRAKVMKDNPDVVVVDYLQLIKPDGSRKGVRYAEVGDISRGLKSIAMDFNIPVIVLCQLNRISSGKDKEPTMSELRESGDIEQDASIIMLMWNADETDQTSKMVNIAKARQGQTCKKQLYFDAPTMTFSEFGASSWANPDDDIPFV